MSIYIKGMEMPESCRYCAFRHSSLTQNAFCTAAHETIDYVDERTKRLDNCPLVPVPPHGRLIDADALEKDGWFLMRYDSYAERLVRMTLKEVPTITEAEETSL